MRHHSQTAGLMNQIDSLLCRHLEFGDPGRFAFLQETFEGLVDTAAEFAFSQRARDMRSAGRTTVGEGEDVIDGKRNAKLVDAANHFANAILPNLLKFRQLTQQNWVRCVEKV